MPFMELLARRARTVSISLGTQSYVSDKTRVEKVL